MHYDIYCNIKAALHQSNFSDSFSWQQHSTKSKSLAFPASLRTANCFMTSRKFTGSTLGLKSALLGQLVGFSWLTFGTAVAHVTPCLLNRASSRRVQWPGPKPDQGGQCRPGVIPGQRRLPDRQAVLSSAHQETAPCHSLLQRLRSTGHIFNDNCNPNVPYHLFSYLFKICVNVFLYFF